MPSDAHQRITHTRFEQLQQLRAGQLLEQFISTGIDDLPVRKLAERSISTFDRDIGAGQFIKAPSTVLSAAEPGVACARLERTRARRPANEASGSERRGGRRQSDWPILLVIACRSQSRLAGKLIRFSSRNLCDSDVDYAYTAAAANNRVVTTTLSGRDSELAAFPDFAGRR